MARDDVVTIQEGAITQLTADDATTITFLNRGPGRLGITVTVGAVAPTTVAAMVAEYGPQEGELAVALTDLSPGIAGTRVYGHAFGGICNVKVSHD